MEEIENLQALEVDSEEETNESDESSFLIVDPSTVVQAEVMQNLPPSQLVIIRQNALQTEMLSKNGIQKRVHVVVKNQPFLIQIGLISNVTVDNMKVDFNKFSIEPRLLYDCDNLKEVDFVKLKPMEVKTHPNERGDQVTVELRIKVLTSQLEDMCFRVRLSALHPHTKERIDTLVVISEPIKVVSKPEKINKPKKAVTSPKQSSSAQTINNNNNSEVGKKRSIEDMVKESLSKIEAVASQQRQFINQLLENASSQQTQTVNIIENLGIETIVPLKVKEKEWVRKDKKKEMQPPTRQTEFESAFIQFMSAYDKLEHDQRPEKIRKLMKTSARNIDTAIEMFDLYASEAASGCPQSDSSSTSESGSTCACGLNCSFKKELERIDLFYDEFLSAPNLFT